MKLIASAVVCALAAAGCMTDVEPELSTADTNVEIPNRLAANRLAANRLAANRLASAQLTATAPDLVAMGADPGGLELLSYIISCAEPPGYSITVNNTVLTGDVGLAPNWPTRALTIAERKWVSACLLARVNYFGVSVLISMRTTSGELSTAAAERKNFTLVEGAFWGDVFTGDQPMVMNACRSNYKATNPQVSTMPKRECTVPDPLVPGSTRCGFAAKGACETTCTNQLNGDRFSYCSGGATEVITVSLAKP